MSFKTAVTIWGETSLWGDMIPLASKFDLLNTDYRIPATDIASLRALNPDIVVLGYRDMIKTQSNLPDWATVDANESWFWHYADGTRCKWVYSNYTDYLMDVGSIGWRNYFASYMKQQLINNGMNGVFVDDVFDNWGVNDTGQDIYGLNVPAWSTLHSGTYKTTCTNFLAYVKSQFGNLLVVGNGPNNTVYPNACDGKFGENFLTMPLNWGGNAIDDVNALYSLSGAGKYYVTFGRAGDRDSMMYCLSGFLLGLNGANAFFDHGDYYDGSGNKGWYPEMQTAQAIGTPAGAYYSSQNVYIRDFTNGKAILNTSSIPRQVNVGNGYKYLNGAEAPSVIMLAGYRGEVLLSTALLPLTLPFHDSFATLNPTWQTINGNWTAM